MMAIVYLAVFAVYFFALYKFARYVYHALQDRDRIKALALSWFIVLIGSGLVFWDTIPTWYTHHHLCNTEAGLKVFIEPDVWRKANPDAFLQVRAAAGRELRDSYRKTEHTGAEEISRSEFTKNFVLEYRRSLAWDYAFHTKKFLRRMIYEPKNEVLFEEVDFGSASGSSSLAVGANDLADYKFWTVTGSCERAYPSMAGKFKFHGHTFNDLQKNIEEWNKK